MHTEIKKYEMFITPNFIYLPFESKETIDLSHGSNVFCDNKMTTFKGNKINSTVSGKALGTKKLNSIYGIIDTLVIENDFKDKKESFSKVKKNIFDYTSDEVKNLLKLNDLSNKDLILNIEYKKDYFETESIILEENISEILETLDLLNSTYDIKSTNILINSKDIVSYNNLITFLGTYPNINIVYKTKKNDNNYIMSVDEITSIYNKLKNKKESKDMFLTINNKKKIIKVKVRKYVNLLELLNHLNITAIKININNDIILTDFNYTLTNEIKSLKIME